MATRFNAPIGSVLRIPFGTYDANGASVTMTGFTVEDIRIYKDGGLVERGPDAGYTVFTDFDGLTGIHVLEIDTSEDDSPAGFWTVGSEFMVIVTSVTVNSQTVRYPAAWFRLVAAESVAGYTPVDVVYANGVAAPTASGRFEVNLTHIANVAVSTSTAQLGVNVVNAGGTAWASGSLTSGVFASGAITATAIAADAIGASELAADAVAEIADAVWDEDATAHQTQGTFGQAIGDPVADTNTIFKAVVTDATGATVGVDVAAVLDDTGTSGVASVTGNVGGNVTGSVGSVVGNVGGNVTGSVGSVGAGGITAASIATGAIDADALATDAVTEIWGVTVEGSYTALQMMRLYAAALGGKASGLATATAVYRDTGDSTDRISATVDADGNRTAVTLTLT